MNHVAIQLVFFLLGQSIGIGFMAGGTTLGIISILGSMFSGYMAISEILKKYSIDER